MSETEIFVNYIFFDFFSRHKESILCTILIGIGLQLDLVLGCYITEYIDGGKEKHRKYHDSKSFYNFFAEVILGAIALAIIAFVLFVLFIIFVIVAEFIEDESKKYKEYRKRKLKLIENEKNE